MGRSKLTGPHLTSKELQEEIKKLFNKIKDKDLTAGFIKKTLNVANNKDSIRHAMEQLKGKHKPPPSAPERIAANQRDRIIGKVDLTRSGSGYVISEGRTDDVFIQNKNLNTAMQGDLVQVRIYPNPRGRRPEGEVTKVMERSLRKLLGTIRSRGQEHALIPEGNELPFPVAVHTADLNGAKNRDKVVVEMSEWPTKDEKWAYGKVTHILGGLTGLDLAMNTILIENGFDIGFSKEVEEEANAFSGEITKADLSTRRDFRGELTFTIDPEDAQDFDDALSYKILANGHVEIGIHIADVSHYVKPNSELDKEAYLRSTSVYLADRCCPMLPEILSNNLCSLRPNEDKRCFSAVFQFDENIKIVDRWFGRTIIHSQQRFSYEEAQAILDEKQGPWSETLLHMNKIAHHLRKKRFQHGAIAFESEEVRFKFDKQGMPVEAVVKIRQDANLLIEDFMLLANREVAVHVARKGKAIEIPFVYRVHDLPSVEKMGDLALFAKEMGFHFNMASPKTIIASYNHLAEQAQINPTLKMLQPLAIRTMSKAVYSSVNIGHYGLGFEYYSHFTSPIRRYSDVLTHRLLFDTLDTVKRADKIQLEAQCKHISAMERKAMEAERESTKFVSALYLSDKIGKVFDGVVSGMIDRGLFIELANIKSEGLISFDSLSESFTVAPSRLKAIGKKTGREIKLGDIVRVRLLAVNIEAREIDLAWEGADR